MIDAIIVRARLITQGGDPSTAVLMTISGKPKLHGNEYVFLEDVKIDSADITDPEKFSKFVETLINPLINLHRFDKPNFALRLDDISVKSKSVSLTGQTYNRTPPALKSAASASSLVLTCVSTSVPPAMYRSALSLR